MTHHSSSLSKQDMNVSTSEKVQLIMFSPALIQSNLRVEESAKSKAPSTQSFLLRDL